MTRFYKGKQSQMKSFEENPDCNFFIAQDFEYTKDGKKKTSKQYACFPTLSDFHDTEPTLTKTCYETLKAERVAIFDIDGYYTNPVFQNLEGKPASTQEIIDEFISAYQDFHEEKLPDLPIPKRSNFLIKKTDDPKGLKESLHIIVRNGYKFQDHKHQKSHALEFKKYCIKENFKVQIDTSIYSANRVIRILGHHKLGQTERKSYRSDHTKYNLDCDVSQFFASYLNGDEKLYPEIGKSKKAEEEFLPKDLIKLTENPVDYDKIQNLTELILETIDNEISPICDDEIKNKICYEKWYRLVLTVFNCLESVNESEHKFEYTCKFVFDKLWTYYRHCEQYEKEKFFDDLFKSTGQYKELTINSLHFLARYNEKYQTEFAEEIKEYKEKVRIARFNKSLKKALKYEKKNEPIVNYIHEINKLCRKSYKEPFTLKSIEETMKNIVINVINGGKAVVFTRSSYYDECSLKNIEKYYPQKFSDMAKEGGACNMVFRHIHPDFEQEFKVYNMLSDKDKKKVKKDQIPNEYTHNLIASRGRGLINDLLSLCDIETKKNICFIPHLKAKANKIDKNYNDSLNIFTGFAYDDEEDSEISDWLNSKTRHNLKKYLCSDHENFFNYFERYIAHMIQHPRDVPGIMVVFSGAQGTGKDLMVEFLSAMIGSHMYHSVEKIATLFGNFNSDYQGKLLIRINEINDKGVQFEKHNELKGILTAKTIRIEPKGIDPYSHEHYSRYIGFSNKKNILQVEESDRRLAMITTDNSMIDNKPYFIPLVEEKQNPKILRSAFKYFSTLSLDNFNIRVIPQTEYRKNQKINSLSSSYKFVLDIFEENRSNDIKILLKDMYYKYLSWCSSEGMSKYLIKKTFTTDLETLGLKRERIRVNNKQGLGYIFNHVEIQELFRKFLRDDTFEIERFEE
jgi:ribosomal protein S8